MYGNFAGQVENTFSYYHVNWKQIEKLEDDKESLDEEIIEEEYDLYEDDPTDSNLAISGDPG